MRTEADADWSGRVLSLVTHKPTITSSVTMEDVAKDNEWRTSVMWDCGAREAVDIRCLCVCVTFRGVRVRASGLICEVADAINTNGTLEMDSKERVVVDPGVVAEDVQLRARLRALE